MQIALRQLDRLGMLTMKASDLVRLGVRAGWESGQQFAVLPKIQLIIQWEAERDGLLAVIRSRRGGSLPKERKRGTSAASQRSLLYHGENKRCRVH